MSGRSEKHMVSVLIGRPPTACNQPWDETQDAILMDLSKYYSRKDIAARMGRTPLGVQSRCRVLGIRLIRDDISVRRHYDRSFVEGRATQEENDRRFVRALALSMFKGEHLPCQG